MENITEHFKIHDQFQFEIKFDYALSPSTPHTQYEVETYFFLPNSLGLNQATYPADLFYRDLQTYIRFLPPRISMEEMAQKGQGSTFHDLQSILNRVCEIDKPIDQGVQKIKMFCNSFRDTARDFLEQFRNSSNAEDQEEKATQFLGHLERILKNYRELKVEFDAEKQESLLYAVFGYGDEYLSTLAEKFSFLILESLRVENERLFRRFEAPFLDFIRQELAYRRRHYGWNSVDGPQQAEQTIYRHGVLKRFFEGDLFINTRLKAEQGGLTMQATYGLAAGVAMLFATSVAFYAQKTYGNFTLPLLTALVVSYIFKDRLKELMRAWLYSNMARNRYDHKTAFFVRGRKIGYAKEYFSFQKLNDLDPDVLRLRNQTRLATLETSLSQEQVFCFKKSVRILSKQIRKQVFDPVPGGVTDLMRFNVQKLLRKMDNPQKSIFRLDGKSYKEIKGRKVYHLNVITRYKSGNQIVIKRNRLILSREGILSIQPVEPISTKP